MNETIDAEYTEHGASLAVRETAVLATPMPMVTPEEARASMDEYIKVCNAVLTADDYQVFKERGKEKRFKKKSAVKKLQTFWGIDVGVREVTRDDLGDGHFGFRVIATAKTASGRKVEATGGCSTFEERFEIKRYDEESENAYAARLKKANARSYHDVMSTAETRATNRAVMNCIGVGGGEVTADEISRDRRDYQAPPRAAKDEPPKPPDVTALIARAQALGIVPAGDVNAARVALRAYCDAHGVAWRPSAVAAHLDAYRAPAAAARSSDAQRRLAMALFGQLGYDESQRHDFYEQVVGHDAAGEPCRSWAHVVAANAASKVIDALQVAVKGLPT